jgi:hypothetical protein
MPNKDNGKNANAGKEKESGRNANGANQNWKEKANQEIHLKLNYQ